MKTSKACLVILCLLPVLAIGMPQLAGANLFMKILIVKHKRLGNVEVKYSECDSNFILSRKWTIATEKSKLYVTTPIKNNHGGYSRVKLHRLITECEPGKVVDHKDGDGLNNTRENLRICSNKDNCSNCAKNKNNKTGYKGVIVDKRILEKKYRGQITHNYKCIKLGYFKTPEEAAQAYNEAAIKYFGEFARLNDIPK